MSATDRSLRMKQPHELSRCCPGIFGVLIMQPNIPCRRG